MGGRICAGKQTGFLVVNELDVAHAVGLYFGMMHWCFLAYQDEDSTCWRSSIYCIPNRNWSQFFCCPSTENTLYIMQQNCGSPRVFRSDSQ